MDIHKPGGDQMTFGIDFPRRLAKVLANGGDHSIFHANGGAEEGLAGAIGNVCIFNNEIKHSVTF